MNSLSLIINTCAGAAHAQTTPGGDGRGLPHAFRAYALRNFIIPRYLDWVEQGFLKELIVVGEWEEGPYTYLHAPSAYHSSADALVQRHYGAEEASGDIVIFQHDDHMLAEDFCMGWQKQPKSANVYVPQRWTRLRNVEGERLNSGEPELQPDRLGYISGHCILMDRTALKAVQWKDVPAVRIWDKEHTTMLVEAGLVIQWHTEHLRVYDVEFGSRPWV